MTKNTLRPVALAALLVPVLALAAPAARALDMVALDEAGVMTRFSDKNTKVTETVNITGASGKIVGFDVRPSNGELYGLSSDGGIYRIKPGTGQATLASKLSGGALANVVVVDFNPIADRMRIVTADGRNLRVNVDTGEATEDGRVAYADKHATAVTGGGYTNSMKGALTTDLYLVDGTDLVLQDPPNLGTLTHRSMIAPSSGTKNMKGGDVHTDRAGISHVYIVGGANLFRIDVPSGQLTKVGMIGSSDNLDLVDVAVVKGDN